MLTETLPLYGPVLARVLAEAPLELNKSCERCTLHTRARNVCVGADGEPGGVLFVGEGPGKTEDILGRPFVGDPGRHLRKLVAKLWTGPVAYDNAVRCYPGADLSDKDVDACRGYLTQTIDEVRPKRIIALGGFAAYSLLGRAPPVMSVRRGYGWLTSDVPVLMVLHPAAALRNRFVNRWFEQDLQWALTTDVPAGPWKATTHVVGSLESAHLATRELRAAPWFAFDVETSGDMFTSAFSMLSLAACASTSDTSWIWDQQALANPETRDVLCQLLRDPTVKKVGQNVKYDMLACRLALGVHVQGIHGDTRLWRKLINPDADGSLAVMAELVGMGGHKEEAHEAQQAALKLFRKPRGKAAQVEPPPGLDPAIEAAIRLGADPKSFMFAFMPRDVLLRYNARDAVSTARLGVMLEAEVAEVPELQRTWDRVIKPATPALEQVEAWGIGVSELALQTFSAYLAQRQIEIQARFVPYGAFNPDSVKDVSQLLYEKLRLSPPHTTKRGAPSTDAEALEELKLHHPVAGDLLEWRKIRKLKGTYADGMLPHVRSDSRIHPNLLLDGARSGRLSCKDPNLQNIPRAETPEGQMARSAFVAPPGRMLLQLDYSQLELRVAAMLSGDEAMRQIFLEGVDFHQRTAEFIAPIVWGIQPSQVEKLHRTAAKTFNFGVLYGMSDAGIVSRTGCTFDEAVKIRQAILGKFRRLAKWTQECLSDARSSGVSWTWWAGERARRRPLWRILDQDAEARINAENSSWNTPVQGTASDFCLASLTKTVNWIREACSDAKLVLAVHDSLLLEVAEQDVPEVAYSVRQIMTTWETAGVPLEVDIEVGPSWGNLVKFKL